MLGDAEELGLVDEEGDHVEPEDDAGSGGAVVGTKLAQGSDT